MFARNFSVGKFLNHFPQTTMAKVRTREVHFFFYIHTHILKSSTQGANIFHEIELHFPHLNKARLTTTIHNNTSLLRRRCYDTIYECI